MDLFPGLDLKIYWHTDETSAIDNVDENAEIKLSQYTLREHTFYTIDFVRNSDYENVASIGSGGYMFLVNESKESVNKKIADIKQNQIFNIN